MGLIDWRADFSLDIAEVDEEHRVLIELINELHQELVEEPEETTVAEFLGEIYTAITSHFALEERLMREQDYPEYTAHKYDHGRLLNELRGMMDAYEDRQLVDPEEIGARLEAWFSVHFRTYDARMHGVLHSQPPA